MFRLWKNDIDQPKPSVGVKKFLKEGCLHNLLRSADIFLSTGRVKMNIEPIDSDKKNKEDESDVHIPFDGFINVNKIVEKRRNLRGTDYQTSDPETAPDIPS